MAMQFLKDELSAGRHSVDLAFLSDWELLSDDEFVEKVRVFSANRSFRHPVLAHTLGKTSENRFAPTKWELETIPLNEIYVEKLARRSMADLELVGHNLAGFSREHASKYVEYSAVYRGSRLPTVIVLQPIRRSHKERYFILDGRRRAISLVRVGGVFDVKAWVGTPAV